MFRFARLLLLACLAALAVPLAAAPAAVPGPLQPWRDWVLDGHDYVDCPVLPQRMAQDPMDFRCAWPGALSVDADADGAQFAVRWQLQAEGWVPLPGDADYWPQAVRVDGQAAPVVMHEGVPQLRLPRGDHAIAGHIEWERRPQALRVPDGIGLVRLQVDGTPIFPVRHENGELVLGRGASEAPEADSLTLRVYRRLQDGLPATLETRIQIGASGQAREELLGPVLPAGFVPLSLRVAAGWPARLEPDGRLRVQVQPDSTEIVIFARAVAPLAKVSVAAVPPPWPAQEVWSYQSAPEQRVTSASGPPQVDPAQAGVPGEWQGLPAFAMAPGPVLAIEVRSRGLGSSEANRLQLQREAWLDFSGAGWTLRDQVTGRMRQGWRLDVAAPYKLEQARDLGEDQGLLVTKGAHGDTGVEWRTPQVQLSAGLRLPKAAGTVPVTGWRADFDNVAATLHLPPGYQLLAAPGADEAAGSWISRWDLLDVFLVAVLVLLAWHGLGRVAAGLTFAYLLVAYHEPGAPLLTLGTVLGLGLLLRAFPAGRLQAFVRFVRVAALALLALVCLPFAADQLRMALYPQLEQSTSGGYAGIVSGMASESKATLGGEGQDQAGFRDEREMAADAGVANAPVAPPPPPSPAMEVPNAVLEQVPQPRKIDQVTVTGSLLSKRADAPQRKADGLERYGQNTVVQAGRGLPGWRHGHTYQLSWSGPVTAGQDMRLLVAPPWLVRPLRVVAVALLAWLLLRLAGASLPGRFVPPRFRPATPLAAALALALAVVAPTAAAEEEPSAQLLQELQQRLLRPPPCAPECVAIAAAQVSADGAHLSVALDVHAQADAGVPLPMDPKSLSVLELRVDGAPGKGVRREDGYLVLAVDRGVHRVQVDYRIDGERVALAFPARPRRIDFSGTGWQPAGISEGRLLTETLGLSRVREAQAGAARGGPVQEFPPFVRVVRRLTLGLDWTVDTQVVRLAPQEGGFSVKLPLLPGERVLTPGLRVREGTIEVPIPDGQSVVSWHSSLDKADALALVAPPLGERAEHWRVVVSPLWRAGFAGLPESVVDGNASDWHEYVFDPLPGETLKMTVTKPEAVVGETQAIERVRLVAQVGQRASDYALDFELRASQGGERVLVLPAAAELLSVQRNGETLSLRLDKGRLSLPVSPGAQTYAVRFRDDQAAGAHNRTPKVGFGLAAANIDLLLGLPDDRWVLHTHGPRSGPAVLYWGELAVLLLVAYGLSRLRWTPLKLRDWLLLGLGFSTFNWFLLAIVVAWLFALAWREREGAQPARAIVFDTMQLLLLMLTAAALVALVWAIPHGLTGRPDMHLVNPQADSGLLQWFADQSKDALPEAGAISVPMWVYRAAMLAWALWLANAVLRWMRWGLQAWTAGGWWRPLRQRPAPPPVDTSATPPPPAGD